MGRTADMRLALPAPPLGAPPTPFLSLQSALPGKENGCFCTNEKKKKKSRPLPVASWGENQAFQLASFGGGVIRTLGLARQLWFLQIPGCLGVRSRSLVQVEMVIALGTSRGWVLPRPLWTDATEKLGERESVMPTSRGTPPQ